MNRKLPRMYGRHCCWRTEAEATIVWSDLPHGRKYIRRHKNCVSFITAVNPREEKFKKKKIYLEGEEVSIQNEPK